MIEALPSTLMERNPQGAPRNDHLAGLGGCRGGHIAGLASPNAPSISQTLSAKSASWPLLPLPWSHYVRLLTVVDPKAREYYEREAFQGGWSVRQVDRQIASLAYQRTGSARSVPAKDEILPADAHVRDPFVLANQMLAREYHLNLPGEAEVAARIKTVRRLLLGSPARLASPPAT